MTDQGRSGRGQMRCYCGEYVLEGATEPQSCGNPTCRPPSPSGRSQSRYPTLPEAIFGALRMRSWPMGPEEAATIASATALDWMERTLPRCDCGWYVVLCQHRQSVTDGAREPDWSYRCPRCGWSSDDTRYEQHGCPSDDASLPPCPGCDDQPLAHRCTVCGRA